MCLPGGRTLEFGQIESVYWRNYGGPAAADLPDAEQAFIAANDSRSLLESLLLCLPARWVNGLAGYRWHQAKPAALARVAALGVEVPATVVTNDPQAVLAFVDRHERCIFKPVQGGAHTERVQREHLSEQNLASLGVAPVTIQEEVPGADVRVFVAGQRVLACEIRTEVLDFRNDPAAEIVAIDLPSDVADACRRAAAALDLVWTGIDLRRRPDGRHVFLEANPSPMFLGFERRCGLPLTESLADLLLGRK
jgi:glutathione synthase/RimK-type ligase-like ATP-grasp enzyme